MTKYTNPRCFTRTVTMAARRVAAAVLGAFFNFQPRSLIRCRAARIQALHACGLQTCSLHALDTKPARRNRRPRRVRFIKRADFGVAARRPGVLFGVMSAETHWSSL